MPSEFKDIVTRIQSFSDERDWSQFHTPKNLVLSLVSEIGELAEIVQWKSDAELENYLNSHGLNAEDLKENGTSHQGPYNAGTNRTNFTGLPAGTGWNNGNNFAHKNGIGTFLSATIDTVTGGILGRGLYYDRYLIARYPLGPVDAWSLRCFKD